MERWRCVKDVFMDKDGSEAFTKDRTYVTSAPSPGNSYRAFTNNQGRHHVITEDFLREHFERVPDRPVLKRTEVEYITQEDGSIRIVDIRNAVTAEEIRDAFGEQVAMMYLGGFPHYVRDGSYVHVAPKDGWTGSLYVGRSPSRDKFGQAIRTMKAAGKRLVRIRKNLEEGRRTIILI